MEPTSVKGRPVSTVKLGVTVAVVAPAGTVNTQVFVPVLVAFTLVPLLKYTLTPVAR